MMADGTVQNASHELGAEGGAQKVCVDRDLKNICAFVKAAVGDQIASFLIVVKDEKGVATAEVIPVCGTTETTDVRLPMFLEVDDSIQIGFRRAPDFALHIELLVVE